MMISWKRALQAGAMLGLFVVSGCDRQGNFSPVDMWNRSRYKPYEEANFYPDRSSSRAMPVNTVARGQLKTDEPLHYGTQNGRYVTRNPIKVDIETVQRGQERYNIYCQPCHGQGGYGDGMIVKRGFSPPPSYHIARLRQAPDGHMYDVITNGYGAMYSYASRVPVQDRWAIVAYIRALQKSQEAKLSDIPAKEREYLMRPRTKSDNGTGIAPGRSQDSLSNNGPGPNDTTEIAPVPAIIGPKDASGAAENQKAG